MSTEPAPGDTFTFVIFEREGRKGQATITAIEKMRASLHEILEEHFGSGVQIIASIDGLSSQEATTLHIISQNAEGVRTETRGDLQRLLRFTFETIEPITVRRELCRMSKADLPKNSGDQVMDVTMRYLFDLYETSGEDPEAFEREADTLTEKLSSGQRGTCLTTFRMYLYNLLPEIRRRLAANN